MIHEGKQILCQLPPNGKWMMNREGLGLAILGERWTQCGGDGKTWREQVARSGGQEQLSRGCIDCPTGRVGSWKGREKRGVVEGSNGG